MLPGSLVSWIMFSGFVLGSIGGLVRLADFFRPAPRRVIVHHRYHPVPIYFDGGGYRAGDMAQDNADQAEPPSAA